MTNTDNTSGGHAPSKRVEKQIKVDRKLWQRVRDEAAANGITTSKAFERILSSYLNPDE